MIDLPPNDATLSTDQGRRVDRACDQFEAAWKAAGSSGARPRIEDALQEVSEEDRPRVLHELIHLDIFYRRQLGETPQPGDYQSRFPSLDAASLAVYFAASSLTVDMTSTPSPGVRAETPASDSTPLSRRFRCPHCHNPIQLADDHSDEVLCPGCGSSFRVREAKETISATPMRPLGKFQLLERIGTGGFGAVWRARDTSLDRIVALKIPHTGLLTAAEELERFQREARAAAQLRHSGIVHVNEVVTLDGLPIIVSDFVVGVSLKELLETRRLTFRESAALIAAVADAAHYAHTQNVIHRDLKPANIMIPYAAEAGSSSGRRVPQLDRPMLMDFGLALRSEAEVTLTQEGNILGTPAYMSPEQATGQSHQADARSDVWSMGVILYELLCGELPFRGSKLMIMTQVVNDDPRAPRRLNDRVPRDLETICLKALAKEPRGRYQTAGELGDDLRRYLAGEPIQARPVSRWERNWRWCRRNPVVASLTALVAFILLASSLISWGLAAWALGEKDRADDQAEKMLQQKNRADEQAEIAKGKAGEALQQKRRADEQTELAKGKAEEALQEKRQAVEALDLAELRLYASKVAQAQQAWQDNDVSSAKLLLDESNKKYRHLEYRLLWTQFNRNQRTFRGHRSWVISVCLSADGKRIVSGSGDNTVKVWDADKGQELLTLKGHTEPVSSVCLSTDGKRIVSGSWDKTVKVWDADKGQELLTLKGHTAKVHSVCLSADGKRIVSGSEDKTVKVWDADKGQELLTLKGHTLPVYSVCLSADGKRIVSGSLDKTVKVWDADKETEADAFK